MYYFFPFIPLIYIWLGWALYVFVMGIYRAYLDKRLKGLNLIMAAPIAVFAIIMDVAANLFLAPILFLDLPKELLVTSRFKRYMAQEAGWRKRVSTYICENMLDIFDPRGDHC